MSKRRRAARKGHRTELTVRVDDLAAGGDGVAHAMIDGQSRAVFIPRVALGDEVTVDVDLASRPARGRVTRLLAPGRGRVAPPCAYVEACGACDWLHMTKEAQRDAREQQLTRGLPPQFRHVPLVFHEPTPALGYRTRGRLHVRASGGRAVVGMHGIGSHDVVEVSSCVVLHPALDAAVAEVARLLEGAHGRGDARLALGHAGTPVVDLAWSGSVPPATFGRLEAMVRAGTLAGGRISLEGTSRPAIVGDPRPSMSGGDGELLVLAPGGFAQTSDEGNRVLAARVLALALALAATGSARESASVVELFAGAGNFTVLLARAFGRVTSVELDEAACDAARANLNARGLSARVTCADADTFLLPAKTDLVVLDPPRRGAKDVARMLASSRVKGLVYVSCDVPTLSRDLAGLAATFDAVAIESFALFPGTSHAETVVAMRRRARRSAEP